MEKNDLFFQEVVRWARFGDDWSFFLSGQITGDLTSVRQQKFKVNGLLRSKYHVVESE